MAKRWSATPTVYGKDAQKIIDEMINGTPNTPERLERFRQADETYRLMTEKMKKLDK